MNVTKDSPMFAEESSWNPTLEDSGLRWHRQLLWAAFGAGLALAIVLRWRAVQESLWIDELHTAWVATGPWHELYRRAAIGNQTVVFFGIEWWLIRALGAQDWVLRLPSLIASLVAALAIFFLARQATQRTDWAFVCLLIAATDGHAVFFGTEARPYALVLLMAVLHVAALWRWSKANRSGYALAWWIITGVLMFHLHVANSWYLAWEIAVVLVAAWKRQCLVRTLWWVLLKVTVLLASALLCFRTVTLVWERWEQWTALRGPSTLIHVLASLHLGWYLLGVWLVVLAAVLVGERHRAKQGLWPLSVWLWLVPTAGAWGAMQLGLLPVVLPRYLVATAPAAWLAVAQVGAQLSCSLRHWLNRVGLGVVLGLVVWLNGPRWQMILQGQPWRNENWRNALAVVQEHFQTGDVILLRPGLLELETACRSTGNAAGLVEYLTFPLRTFYSPNLALETAYLLDNTWQPRLEAEQLMRIRRAPRVWIVLRAEPEAADRIQEYLARTVFEGNTGWQVFYFGRVRVVLMEAAKLN